MNVGTHLGVNFKTSVVPINMDSSEVKIAERYLVGEFTPNYSITKNISAGIYYLYVRGLDAGTKRNTNFVTLNANFSNIKLTEKFFMKVAPQFYYLNQDGDDGFYFTSAFTLAKTDFPISISSVINKVIKTNISASKDFVWNVTVIYSFGKRYAAF
jgi:hypothetical protein